jgi:germination protein M
MYKYDLVLGGNDMRRNLIRASVVLFVLAIALTGCLFGPDEKASTQSQIDPPPVNAEGENTKAVQATQETKASEQKEEKGTELYFFSDTGYVVPYTIRMTPSKGAAKEAMKWMVQGGLAEEMLPEGFKPVLPKGTEIKGLNIADGIANIDFSKDFLTYAAKDERVESNILSALTWSLTDFPGVKEVNIWVEGRPLEKMPKFKTPAQGLRRSRGINLEMASGVNVNRGLAVTLYFMGQTKENEIYYVPVTRMINRTDHIAQATLQELIKGPLLHSNLTGALDTMTEINRVEVKGDVVMVDFGEQLLQYHSQGAASEDAINTIVLSLTENRLAQKVGITVNKKNLTSTAAGKDKSWTKPVTRPTKINPHDL